MTVRDPGDGGIHSVANHVVAATTIGASAALGTTGVWARSGAAPAGTFVASAVATATFAGNQAGHGKRSSRSPAASAEPLQRERPRPETHREEVVGRSRASRAAPGKKLARRSGGLPPRFSSWPQRAPSARLRSRAGYCKNWRMPMAETPQEYWERCGRAADILSEKTDADVLFWNGPLVPLAAAKAIDLLRFRRRKTNLILTLTTNGGDPGAAYRLARGVRNKYNGFILFVTGQCKSAGTLVALGADEIVISAHGELGPLDPQIPGPNGVRQSGLALPAAINALQSMAFLSATYFANQAEQNGLNQKEAHEWGINLTKAFLEPICGSIDATRLGEVARHLDEARGYAHMLNSIGKTCKADTIQNLVDMYPSHAFVIDRQPAMNLFIDGTVRAPNDVEELLADVLGPSGRNEVKWKPPVAPTAITFLNTELPETKETK